MKLSAAEGRLKFNSFMEVRKQKKQEKQEPLFFRILSSLSLSLSLSADYLFLLLLSLSITISRSAAKDIIRCFCFCLGRTGLSFHIFGRSLRTSVLGEMMRQEREREREGRMRVHLGGVGVRDGLGWYRGAVR